MVDISIPVTIQTPDVTVNTPFGPHVIPGVSTQCTAVLHIDEAAAAAVVSVLKS